MNPEISELIDGMDPRTVYGYAYCMACIALVISKDYGAERLDNLLNTGMSEDHRRGTMDGMKAWATKRGITVKENPNLTFNGWYNLADALANL